MSEQLNRGPLPDGESRMTEYVLKSDLGVTLEHADSLRDARERAERRTEGDGPPDDIHVVRVDYTVVPEDADAYLWGVVDHALAYELLSSAAAVMEGDADELDHRRPHPPAYTFLYDISETLRHRARYTDTALETGLTPPHANERLEQEWNHIPEERRSENDD